MFQCMCCEILDLLNMYSSNVILTIQLTYLTLRKHPVSVVNERPIVAFNSFNKFPSPNNKVAICVINVKHYVKSEGKIKIMLNLYLHDIL